MMFGDVVLWLPGCFFLMNIDMCGASEHVITTDTIVENMYYQMASGDDMQTDAHHETIETDGTCNNSIKVTSYPLLDDNDLTNGINSNYTIKLFQSPSSELKVDGFNGVKFGTHSDLSVREDIVHWNKSGKLEMIGSLRILDNDVGLQFAADNSWLLMGKKITTYQVLVQLGRNLEVFFLSHNFTSHHYNFWSVVHLQEKKNDIQLLDISIQGDSPIWNGYKVKLAQNVVFDRASGYEACEVNTELYDVRVTAEWRLPITTFYSKDFVFRSRLESWPSFNMSVTVDEERSPFLSIHLKSSLSDEYILEGSQNTFQLRHELSTSQVSQKLMDVRWDSSTKWTTFKILISEDFQESLMTSSSKLLIFLREVMFAEETKLRQILSASLRLTPDTWQEMGDTILCLWKQHLFRLYILDNYSTLLSIGRTLMKLLGSPEAANTDTVAQILRNAFNLMEDFGVVTVDDPYIEIKIPHNLWRFVAPYLYL